MAAAVVIYLWLESSGQTWSRKRVAFGERKAKGSRLSYREISARLKDAGYCNERGQPFKPQSVRAMIEGPQPR